MMRKVLLAGLLLAGFSASAFAQQPPVMLRLSVEEVNTLIGHLEGKWSELNPVVQSILAQTNAQLNARNLPPPKAEEKKAEDKAKDEKPKDK